MIEEKPDAATEGKEGEQDVKAKQLHALLDSFLKKEYASFEAEKHQNAISARISDKFKL